MQAQALLDDVRHAAPAPQATRAADPTNVLIGLVQLSQIASAPPDPLTPPDALDDVIAKGVLKHILAALQARDEAMMQHSRRVAQLAAGTARSLGWDGPQLKVLEVAALLHDVGKVGVPDNILFKQGDLNEVEAEFLAVHVNIGLDVLQAGRAKAELLTIVDQAARIEGLPAADSKQGRDVHQGARILAAADTYDSLRKLGKHNEIMQALSASAGTLFDEKTVAALGGVVEQSPDLFAEIPSGKIPASPEADTLCRVFSHLYVLETLHDGFFLVDANQRITVWNRGIEALLGIPAHDALDTSPSEGLLEYADDDENPFSHAENPLTEALGSQEPVTRPVQLRRHDGVFTPVELQSVPLVDGRGQVHGVVQIVRDLARTKRPSKKAKAKRTADGETARRADFNSELKRKVKEFKKAGECVPFCVMIVQIDHFPLIRDKFGAEAAEQLLGEMGELIQQETYSEELVARDSDARFVVLCPQTDAGQAESRAERLRVAICAAKVHAVGKFNVSASIGITEIEPKDSPATLCERAEKALALVKEAGCNATRSLSAAELVAAQSEGLQTDCLQYNTTFDACIAADMVIYKLGGFVSDEKAKLVKVKSKSAVLRVGKGGMLPVWGGNPQRQPVEIRIDFGEENIHEVRATKSVEIRVQIRPRGFPMSTRRFHERAVKIAKVLRSYFGVVT